MPNVFGEQLSSVAEIVGAFRKHGDAVRDVYRARYVFDDHSVNPSSAARLERPSMMAGNPPNETYPWEQIFLAAAACAGSDYPMLARHLGVPISRVELVIEGVFDPRGEFDGLDGYHSPPDARPCFLSLHLRTTLTSAAPRASLERMHERVVERNMVLGALRGIPRTDELIIEKPAS